MRFFLALWVIIYHQIPPLEDLRRFLPGLEHAVEGLLFTGYAAVGVFFVLSGFVLTYNYDLSNLTSPPNLKRFAVARFSRIYPAYLIALIILIPIYFYRDYKGIDPPETDLITLLLNIALLQAWLPGTALSWNFPGWSLSNEAFFYALFPFVGRLLRAVKNLRTLVLLGLAMWALALAAPLIAALLPIDGFGDVAATQYKLESESEFWANLIRYNPLVRLPEFCLGILLALLFRRLPEEHWLWNRGAWLYLPAGAAALLVLINADRIPYPLMHNSLLLPLYACIVFGFALEGGTLARWLSRPSLVFLGNASYSMYILHAPLFIWLTILFRSGLHREPVGWSWFISYLVLVIGGSCIFFRIVEDRLHRTVRRKLSGTNRREKITALSSA